MKKFCSISLAILACLNLFAQKTGGTWNAKNCTYINTVYEVSWGLPTEIDWKKMDATGPNICFKAIDPETGLMLILNVKNDQNYGSDIWPSYKELSSQVYKDSVIRKSRAAGVTIKSMDVVKSQIDGVHAIKTTTAMKKNDPSLGGIVDIIDISCAFVYNNRLYTADLQALKELKDGIEGFDQVVSLLFSGIKLLK